MAATPRPGFFPALLFLGLLILPWRTAAGAEEGGGWVHLNGYSHHLNAANANGHLWGLGFTWPVKPYGSPATAWEGDVFRDSGRKLSAYVGHSWTWPLGRFAGVGITGAIMHHRNFAKYNAASLMPVGLPYLETKGRALRWRVYYIPPVRSPSDRQVAVQLMVRWGRSLDRR